MSPAIYYLSDLPNNTNFNSVINFLATVNKSTLVIDIDTFITNTLTPNYFPYNLIEQGYNSTTKTLTISPYFSLKYINGYKITIPNSFTLTLNCPFDAGVFQIFNVEEKGILNGCPLIEQAVPQWFYRGQGMWDNAIQRAVDFYPKVFFPSMPVPNQSYLIKNTINLNLSRTYDGQNLGDSIDNDPGFLLYGVGNGSQITNADNDKCIFECKNVPDLGYLGSLIIENLTFNCINGIKIETNASNYEPVEAKPILNVRISNCRFRNLETNEGTAISFKKVFDSEISNNFITGYECGVKLESSDINNISNNRILDFYKYAIFELSHGWFGSQNTIIHNDLLAYKGESGKGAFIKSNSRHVIIRDNYLENQPPTEKNTNEKIFAFIDCSIVDLNTEEQNHADFYPRGKIDITGNRCDAADDTCTNYIYYIGVRFHSLNLVEIPNLGSLNHPVVSTFAEEREVESSVSYIPINYEHLYHDYRKIINMVNCESFKQWMSFSSTKRFSDSENGTLIISPENISCVGIDPYSIATFNLKSFKLKVIFESPFYIKIDQKLIEEEGELNSLPYKLKINIITRNISEDIKTSDNDYYIGIAKQIGGANMWEGSGHYITNNIMPPPLDTPVYNNFVKYSLSPDMVFQPTDNYYLVILPKKDKEIRSIEIVDIA